MSDVLQGPPSAVNNNSLYVGDITPAVAIDVHRTPGKAEGLIDAELDASDSDRPIMVYVTRRGRLLRKYLRTDPEPKSCLFICIRPWARS